MNKIEYIKNDKISENIVTIIVNLDGKNHKIEFSIDNQTSNGFQESFKYLPFKEKYGNNYKYYFGGTEANANSNTYNHIVIIVLVKMRYNYKMACSKEFCKNIKWLLELKDSKELTKYKSA
ncbi:MAG: hypothetical protein KAS51_07195 [Candidatus Omnitrophica bacterium]|nr:hypothetical protein [Candidatus Omnitrophota bacterium]